MSILNTLSQFTYSNENGVELKTPSEKLLTKISEAGYDITEMEGVIKAPGNKLILACAGSGKTTSLGFSVLHDCETGELTNTITTADGNVHRVGAKVLVSTFSKTGTDDIARSIKKLKYDFNIKSDISNINFSTLHAEFRAVLNKLGMAKEVISDKENNKLLGSVVKEFKLRFNAEELKDFSSALSYTRNTISSRRYSKSIYTEKGITSILIDSIIDKWAERRELSGYMDFDDMQDTLYKFLTSKEDPELSGKLRRFLEMRYDAIYLDEFQDISEVQYELIKAYTGGSNFKKMVAIGDDDQTIYSWRGSSQNIITKEFASDFNASVQTLTKNRRTPNKILDSVVPSINVNSNRYPKSITSSKEGGVIRFGCFNSYGAMSLALYDTVEACVKHGRSVVILCRTNMDGLLPAFTLERSDTSARFKITSETMTLDSYIGKQIMSIFSLVNGMGTADTERAVKQLCGYRFKLEGSVLVEGLRSRGDTIWSVDEEDLKHSVPNLYIKHLKFLRNKQKEFDSRMEFLLFLLDYYKDNSYNGDSDYHATARSIIDTLKILATLEDYTPEFSDFLHDVKELNNQLKARKSLNANIVNTTISTVHEFKGKEVDDVIIWNASDESFPHNLSDDIEEERRLWYIACTRARRSLTILSPKSVSPFINEMDFKDVKKISPKISLRK